MDATSLSGGPFVWPIRFRDISRLAFIAWGRLRLLFCEAPVEQGHDLPRIRVVLDNISQSRGICE